MLKDEFKLVTRFDEISILFFLNEKKNISSKKKINNLINKISRNGYFFSKSHTYDFSVIAYSKLYKIGVDIEKYQRKVSKTLEKKIVRNNQFLNLKPIELWTLMESSYKCINTKYHFTSYEFYQDDEWFVVKNQEMKIFSKYFNYNNNCVSISMHRDQISIDDFHNRTRIINRK